MRLKPGNLIRSKKFKIKEEDSLFIVLDYKVQKKKTFTLGLLTFFTSSRHVDLYWIRCGKISLPWESRFELVSKRIDVSELLTHTNLVYRRVGKLLAEGVSFRRLRAFYLKKYENGNRSASSGLSTVSRGFYNG